jgi:hypothetical protein
VKPPTEITAVDTLLPEEILRLTPEGADDLLARLETEVPVEPALALPETGGIEEAIVFGDTHGDWRSTRAAAERFLEAPSRRALLGLGDYIDRAPDDCGEGSVANALYLLGLKAAYPERVWLLQGNHETARRIGVSPHDLPEEVDLLWGPEPDRYARLLGLLERGPFALRTPNGAYLAHAGFPSEPPAADWKAGFARATTEEFLIDLVWRDCAASRHSRGTGAPFTERDLDGFLAAAGCTIFLRGHDPDLIGRPVFGGRCLTLHTSRLYERYGGVLVARLPWDRPVRSAAELRIEHLETEGREFNWEG